MAATHLVDRLKKDVAFLLNLLEFLLASHNPLLQFQ
jgi:hypothetical protein